LSLCCKKDENGKSILDLLKAIKLEVDDNDLISMLETKVFKLAGENIADTQRFNLNIAKDTLMILEGSSIPKIQEGSFPSTVTEVSFKSDCSDVPMLPFSEENQAQLLKGVLVFPKQ